MQGMAANDVYASVLLAHLYNYVLWLAPSARRRFGRFEPHAAAEELLL
jgi:hypothetical protein